ncbi:hypothetical protein [Streptomyces sp. NPDC047981]|uniref:hypothetical protein n=1 Tax=Streptomyces sp. NPDC047981 TaxID=3154610 RepID=UPI003439753D
MQDFEITDAATGRLIATCDRIDDVIPALDDACESLARQLAANAEGSSGIRLRLEVHHRTPDGRRIWCAERVFFPGPS